MIRASQSLTYIQSLTADRVLFHGLASDEDVVGHEFHGNQFTGGIAGGEKPKMSIADFAKGMIKEGKYSNKQIAEATQKAFGSKTSTASVAWYQSKMKAEAKSGGQPAAPKAPKAMSEKQKAFAAPTTVSAPKPTPVEAKIAAQKADPDKNTPAEPYKTFIGGKTLSAMNSAEKLAAQKIASEIVSKPEQWHPAKVEAAQNFIKASGMGNIASKASPAAPADTAPQNMPNLSSHVSITSGEFGSLKSYTGSGAGTINSVLRAGGVGAHLGTEWQARIEKMDKVMEKSTLDKEVMLYRGIPADAAKAMFGNSVITGQVVSDKAFSSTSLSFGVAKGFSGGVVLHIKSPAGAKGYDVRHISSHQHEAEIILPRGAQFRVTGVIVPMSGIKDHLHVQVEYVQ